MAKKDSDQYKYREDHTKDLSANKLDTGRIELYLNGTQENPDNIWQR